MGERIHIPSSFPDSEILKAYLQPLVDTNKGEFVFSHPNLDDIRKRMKDGAGWTIEKTDKVLIPVLKEIQNRNTVQQSRIIDFFQVNTSPKSIKKHKSKRVNQILSGMVSPKDKNSK